MPNYKYVIKVGRKVMFEGPNPKDSLKELVGKYPNKKISISWIDLSGDVLIAKVQL